MKLALLIFALLCTALLSLATGSVSIAFVDVMNALVGEADGQTTIIVMDIRLPRILLAVLVGGGIAASGAAIQGLFRNPLADPALIGVSAGAALFASLFVVVAGSVQWAIIGLAGSAFIGGVLATWIVLLVGSRGGGLSTMLLSGIAINAIALSCVGLLSYISTDVQLRSISFWALGSLNGTNWSSLAPALLIPFAIVMLVRESTRLNIITLGDEEAENLGIAHRSLRTRVVVFCAIAVGIGVALTGVIAFLGLVVPHLIRLTLGSNHRVVIPASAILGGILLLVADSFSRTVIAPAELPVGIVTALIGGPFFIYLILREQKSRLAI